MIKILQEKITAEESTILQCKISRDNIKNYIKRLEKNSNIKREKAKEALKEKKKDRAKYNLKLSNKFQKSYCNIFFFRR